MLGVLGGMGPLATVDFLAKLVKKTESESDQKHIPTVIWSVPQIPDRSSHIISGTENPFPQLRQGVLALQSMGASIIVIPCNTAHYWCEQLSENTGVTILHIVDAVIDKLPKDLPADQKAVGLLATTGTIKSQIYQRKFRKTDWTLITPEENHQADIMEAINLVKSGHTNSAKSIFLEQIEHLKKQGVTCIILGCTELPTVLDEAPELIDCNLALANRCIKWFSSSTSSRY